MPFNPDEFLNEARQQRAPSQTEAQKQSAGFDPDAFLAEVSQSKQQPATVNPYAEADLGVINRTRYAIEPLQSNRNQLLAQEYGVENVSQDEKGNVFVRTEPNGEFRPVNKEGVSFADFADIAGATPEMVGGGVGALVGLAGGAVTTAGTASIPAAIGLGAAGGAVGSAARQGLSAMLGTPQVATAGERAIETGLSGVMGGIGTGVGIGAKSIIKKSAPVVKNLFPSFKLSREGLALIKISQKEGIPSPSSALVAGGRDLEIEKLLGQRKFFGREIRQQTEAQVKAIKENLKAVAGDFIDADSTRESIGAKVKEFTGANISAIKNTASELFDRVAAEGQDATLPADHLKSSLIKNFGELGLFDNAGNPLAHSSKTGLTEAQFGRLQGIFGKIINDVDGSSTFKEIVPDFSNIPGVKEALTSPQNFRQGTRTIDANTINTMRKFIDSNISEGKKLGLDDAILIKARESFLDVAESALASKNPALKGEFRAARALWKKQLDMNKVVKQLGISENGLSDEKVVARIFRDKKSVKMLKEVVDPKTVDEVGTSFVNDLLTSKLGKEDQIGAAAALSAVKKNREAIIEAIGAEKFLKLRNNLFYLDKIGAPVNPSKTFTSSLMTDVSLKGLKDGALLKGERAIRSSSSAIAKKISASGNSLPGRVGKIANILNDNKQRELSSGR